MRRLPKEITGQTRLAKALALFCFIYIPVLAFFAGMRYEEMEQTIRTILSQESILVPKRYPTPPPRNVLITPETYTSVILTSLSRTQLSHIAQQTAKNYFDAFKTSHDPQKRLLDYKILYISNVSVTKKNTLQYQIQYEVKPVSLQILTVWLVGNGTKSDDGWIRGKTGFVTARETAGVFAIASMATAQTEY